MRDDRPLGSGGCVREGFADGGLPRLRGAEAVAGRDAQDVAGGPRPGDLYAGAVASLVALWAPPLFGGLLIVVLIAVVTRSQRSFLAYDARRPTP